MSYASVFWGAFTYASIPVKLTAWFILVVENGTFSRLKIKRYVNFILFSSYGKFYVNTSDYFIEKSCLLCNINSLETKRKRNTQMRNNIDSVGKRKRYEIRI